MTLRTRLIIGLLVLAAAGLAVTVAVTYREVGNTLVSQRDEQLTQAWNATNSAFNAPPGYAAPQVPSGTYYAWFDGEGRQVKAVVYGEDGNGAPKLPSNLSPSESFTTNDPHYRGIVRAFDGGYVVVAISMHDADATLHKLITVLLIVAGVVILAIALLSWWVVKLGLRPLQQMEETAGRIAEGDLSQRVEIEDPTTEVGRLGIAMNEMMTQIESAFEERAASESRLRRFVGDASHELRTPLTSIRGYAELFRRGAAERPEDLAKAMRRIEEESDRMSVLVEDLLLLARLDQGRPLEHQPVDLTHITADAVDDTRTVAPERFIDFIPNGSVVVAGDEVRLRQVLANLLENAVRYTPPETPIHVRVTNDDTEAVIEVRDEGPGMQPDEAAHVFERFWRADSSRVRTTGGAGLGLAIVSAIATSHGGRAEVMTAPGEGTTFRIHLPRASSNGQAETVPS